MAKDFTAALKNDQSFDGLDISQTYAEREAARQEEARAAQVSKNEPKRRLSLYLPAALYDRVSMFASVSRSNMNQLIISLLEESLTEERLQSALAKLQSDINQRL